MPDSRTLALAAPLVAAACLALPSAAPGQAAKRNWNLAVTRTADGTHVVGNPAARIRLTEFVSYTCPHCAHFERDAGATLRLTFVAGGKGAIEVRHFVRDPVDMTATLLTNCGPPAKFFLNHVAFMRSQARWIAPLTTAGPAQRARWTAGTFAQRAQAIATDFAFYDIMRTRGYSRVEVDRCLADESLATRLARSTAEARDALGVTGTPSFAIDGVVLAGTHTWDDLKPQLVARLGPS